jgi:hypothetical protein
VPAQHVRQRATSVGVQQKRLKPRKHITPPVDARTTVGDGRGDDFSTWLGLSYNTNGVVVDGEERGLCEIGVIRTPVVERAVAVGWDVFNVFFSGVHTGTRSTCCRRWLGWRRLNTVTVVQNVSMRT